MSRVYDTPRYEDQTLNKVWLHLEVARLYSDLGVVDYNFGNKRVKSKNIDIVKHELQQLDLIDADEIDCKSPDDIDDTDLFAQYYIGDAVQRGGSNNLSKSVASGRALSRILRQTSCKPIWCDFDASIRITHGYLKGVYKGSISDKDRKNLNFTSMISKDICVLGLAACRLGSDVTDVIKGDINPTSTANQEWGNMICWNRGMELVRLKSFTPEVAAAHDRLRESDMEVEADSFKISQVKAARTLGVTSMYRIIGLYIIEYEDAVYILDYSSMDQVHQVSKMWEGFFKYSANYRLTGNGTCKREINTQVMTSLKEWIISSLEQSNFSDKLARCMKQSLALLQNDIHPSAEKLDVNLQQKSQKLTAMIKEVMILDTYWHEKLRSLGLSGRVQLDLANMFYALPAPDCNLKLLFERASVYMQKANTASSWDFYEFMNYCMAIDFCKAVVIYKKDVTYSTVEGYSFLDEPWYKSCLKGLLRLPSDEDMGKVWIDGFFPFNNTIPQWYWEAADVTHVLADSNPYSDLKTFADLPRDSHNELLYALDYAPKLSYSWEPKDVLDRLGTGGDNWDRMAVMAVKCENTKPGVKCRETWSADDITRELTTCYDRAAIPIAAMYKGVTARKSDIAVQSIFDRICSMTRRDSKEKVIIMSNDVSGWSPLGDRDAWSQHHDYLIRMTKAPQHLQLKKIWKGIGAYLAKRGLVAHSDLPKGLFQGWTGTCDSIFNVHISLFCVRKAKRAGLLLSSEAANTAGLIDDAVQAVELDPESSIEHQQKAADSHFQITAQTWKSLGAELDTVKTIFSSSKFIYLNRFFCEGSEVFTPMKIFARADKEFNRRYASIFSQLDTILGSYRSSVDKGMCAVTAYYFAISRCMEVLAYANSRLLTRSICPLVNAAFAPRGLGGWGIPHIIAWLTQEAQDPLTMYTTTMCSIIDMVPDEHLAEELNTLLIGTLEQDLKVVGVNALINNPRDVRAIGVADPEGDIQRKLKSGMIRKCKSKVFSAALQAGESRETLVGLEKSIKSCRWDASILELLSQCLPSTCSASLVDRAYKNEMITQLFPFRVRSELSSIVRKGGGYAADFLPNKSASFEPSDIRATRSIAYDLALGCRARFYELNCIEVTNHTIPDYGTCLARQHAGPNPGMIVKTAWPTYSCVEDKAQTRNMHDGMTGRDKSQIPKSVSAYTFTGERFRYMTPVQRCVCKAAVVSAYLTTHGNHGKAFWDIVMALWGAEHVVSPPMVTTQIKPGTSTKRLSAAQSHLTHSISAFRNVHGSIEVIADPLGVYLSMKSTHIDYMSMVTAARTIGLLTLACSRGNGEDMYFGFLEGSIPITEDDKLVVFDEESYKSGIEEVIISSDKSLFQQVLESMLDVQYSRGEGEEYVCIGFRDEHMGAARIGREVSIAAGYLSNIVNCGIVASTAIRKHTSLVRLAGDEIISRPTLKADTRMRKLIQSVPRSQAVVCLAMETVKDLCAGGVRMNIAQAPWRHVPEEYKLTFPGWEEQWSNVIHLMKRYAGSIDMSVARALLGNVPHHVATHLCHLDSRSDDSALLVLSYLYLASYGRLRTPESYTLTSALGTTQMARIWGLAAQVRTKLSRKWKTRPSRERQLMGTVYQSLSLACQAYYSKQQVMQSLVKGINLHMMHNYRIELPDAPNIDGRITADLPNRNPYWMRIRDDLLRTLHRVNMDTEYLCKEFDQIANDVYTLGETKALAGVSGEAEILYPATIGEVSELPTLDNIVVGEVVEPEEGPSKDPILIAATMAYLEEGIHLAKLVYNGEEVYDATEEPTEDEISEFLAELRSLEEEEGGGQEGDER